LVGVGPIGSNAVAQSVIPYYNGYFADTWHVKPSVTISYGLSYQVEMPPHEQNSKQVTMVYRDGSPVVTADYMAQRQKAALAGTVYNPTLGFETPNNIGAGRQAFGEVGTTSSATTSFTTNAPAAAPFTGGSSTNYHVAGSGGVGTNNTGGVNMFADPATVIAQFRKRVLGFDGNCGGYALRTVPRWNVDLGVHKTVAMFREGMGADFSFQFTNVLNHVVMGSPALTVTSPSTFGRMTGQANTPRNMEFGLRLPF